MGAPKRTLALDWGMRRIGIAICDELGLTVRGLPTLERTNIRSDLQLLARLVDEHRVERIVVGKPLNMDGSEGKSANLASQFARRLAKQVDAEVLLWDERLTSWEAESMISGTASKGETDQVAATLLLEGYLGSLKA